MWIEKWGTVEVGLKCMWKEFASTSPAAEKQLDFEHLDLGTEGGSGGEESELDRWMEGSEAEQRHERGRQHLGLDGPTLDRNVIQPSVVDAPVRRRPGIAAQREGQLPVRVVLQDGEPKRGPRRCRPVGVYRLVLRLARVRPRVSAEAIHHRLEPSSTSYLLLEGRVLERRVVVYKSDTFRVSETTTRYM